MRILGASGRRALGETPREKYGADLRTFPVKLWLQRRKEHVTFEHLYLKVVISRQAAR